MKIAVSTSMEMIKGENRRRQIVFFVASHSLTLHCTALTNEVFTITCTILDNCLLQKLLRSELAALWPLSVDWVQWW